jgi:hypothetical protein
VEAPEAPFGTNVVGCRALMNDCLPGLDCVVPGNLAAQNSPYQTFVYFRTEPAAWWARRTLIQRTKHGVTFPRHVL